MDGLRLAALTGKLLESNRNVSWQRLRELPCSCRFVRVFHGKINEDSLSGPYEVKDFQMDGPVTSVSLFCDHNSSAYVMAFRNENTIRV